MWKNLYSKKLRLAVTKTTKEISEVLIKTRLTNINDKIIEVIEKWEEPLIDNKEANNKKYFEEKVKDFKD